jgi:hypothetical protein
MEGYDSKLVVYNRIEKRIYCITLRVMEGRCNGRACNGGLSMLR